MCVIRQTYSQFRERFLLMQAESYGTAFHLISDKLTLHVVTSGSSDCLGPFCLGLRHQHFVTCLLTYSTKELQVRTVFIYWYLHLNYPLILYQSENQI